MTQELSRRSFLLGSTTLGAAALAASALGLAPEAAHADEADEAAPAGDENKRGQFICIHRRHNRNGQSAQYGIYFITDRKSGMFQLLINRFRF